MAIRKQICETSADRAAPGRRLRVDPVDLGLFCYSALSFCDLSDLGDASDAGDS